LIEKRLKKKKKDIARSNEGMILDIVGLCFVSIHYARFVEQAERNMDNQQHPSPKENTEF